MSNTNEVLRILKYAKNNNEIDIIDKIENRKPPKLITRYSIEKKKDKSPWVEKYRPGKLKDIVYQDDIISMLKEALISGDLPHLLFYGPPGTGKTSTILALANELFGPKLIRDRVIELNASDERGIGVVRTKIKNFAKLAIGGSEPGYPCPPFKIIILDEADSMTSEAQSALRKIMESNSKITRFCFICNYINQITEPIISRCAKFRFRSIKASPITDRLKYIAKKEHIYKQLENDDVLNKIAELSNGDMRRSIMLLQNLRYLCCHKSKITVDDIYEATSYMSCEKLSDMLAQIKKIDHVIIMTQQLHSMGYPIDNVLEQLVKIIVNSDKISNESKAKIFLTISDSEKKLVDGANEYLQLLNILMCYYQNSINKKLT